MKKPIISVVVPVYNVSEYLGRAVDSILAQSFTDFEVILVDDGSTDRSGEICDEYTKKDERVHVIHKENGGLSDARNAGTAVAEGEYICFVDSDDFLEAEFLSRLYTLVTENGADLSVVGIYDCYKDSRTHKYGKVTNFVIDGIGALELTLEGEKIIVSVCTKLIKAEIAKELSFRVGKTYEDAFYTPDLFLSVKKVAVSTEPLYNYWHRSDSITTRPFSEKAMHVIEAYEYTLNKIKDTNPELIPICEFRINWGYFVVLDRMLATANYKNLEQFSGVVAHLKKNWLKIYKTPYFTRARRISAVALKISLSLYLMLSKMKEKRDGINK